ncbi:hypothetical protein PROFUN_14291 [Planoprotostelium fungivorum]|uniref:Uncharacterized protein n=1 Tax=Planoprotostelium fungivorum TaxID=1890364 RepID=A0A2P6N0J6_9EUKA|nr:hypothetical protein PROFUN_14291 [Planoprotostelium fungivorum]
MVKALPSATALLVLIGVLFISLVINIASFIDFHPKDLRSLHSLGAYKVNSVGCNTVQATVFTNNQVRPFQSIKSADIETTELEQDDQIDYK